MSSEKDIFIANRVFPNAKDVFAVSGNPISEIKDECLFVFDTNSLILPYTTSSESLDEIKKVYSKIIHENRMFIPGQVAREFAKIRPEKIKEVFQQLTRSRSKVQSLSIGRYPLLNGIKEYDELFKKEDEINLHLKEYSKQLGKVIEHIKEWSWNDPVSQLYKSLFVENVILDLEFDEKVIKENLQYRYENKIPPGFEDKNKGDGGIGDLLIWLTILEIAEKHKKDIVFISGDEKKDWFYQVENQALYPKFELIAEFRTKAPGKSFHILKLSELLELYGADEKIVKEVEIEEQENLIFDSFFKQTEGAKIEDCVELWLKENYEYHYLIHDDTNFPDFSFLEKSENKFVGIEIIQYFDKNTLRIKVKKCLSALEKVRDKYNKIIFIVIYNQSLMMDDVIRSLEVLKNMLEHTNMQMEVIPGFIKENRFQKIFHGFD